MSAYVKNRAPAALQITAEQILREAADIRNYDVPRVRVKITNEDELREFQLKKRKIYEDRIRRGKTDFSIWIKYAQWEASQNEYERARSIFQRGVEAHPRQALLYIRYAEMEMKAKFVNHARNVWNQAVTALPRVDQLWLKYAYMEEVLGNTAGAREIFERWMRWKPELRAWTTYAAFETRHGHVREARSVYQRAICAYPEPESFLQFAAFEEQQASPTRARAVYEAALEYFGDENLPASVVLAFAEFEERMDELERSRTLLRYAIDNLTKSDAEQAFQRLTQLEKKFGSKDEIEKVIATQRRRVYEEELSLHPDNADMWMDLVQLEERTGSTESVRSAHCRAVSHPPSAASKEKTTEWKRYIYLWIRFAMYEELRQRDVGRARQVYKDMLKAIPHRHFTFAKAWILAAQFELRQKDLTGARKVLGRAIGMAPKPKVFEYYIDLERRLGHYDRCRILYEKYLEYNATKSATWIAFAEMEAGLEEIDRARALLDIALDQEDPEEWNKVWEAYVQMEVGRDETDRVRALYERRIERVPSVQNWVAFAVYEAEEGELVRAREVFSKAYASYRGRPSMADDRLAVVQSWIDFEKDFGDAASARDAEQKLPQQVKKRRPVKDDQGNTVAWEEYLDYVFPDDEKAAGSLKILEAAQRWKKQKSVQ